MVEASIKNGYVHCLIRKDDPFDVIRNLDELRGIVHGQITSPNLVCVALRLRVDDRKDVYFPQVGEKVLALYDIIRKENEARTRRITDGPIIMSVDCSDVLRDYVKVQLFQEDNYNPIKFVDYMLHLTRCKTRRDMMHEPWYNGAAKDLQGRKNHRRG